MSRPWRGKMDQAEVDARLAVVRRLGDACVAGAAHMVQLEQPGELASRLGRELPGSSLSHAGQRPGRLAGIRRTLGWAPGTFQPQAR